MLCHIIDIIDQDRYLLLFLLCRPVKVVRLLARDTVEEIMYSRAASKLHLTNTVIEEGRFSLLDQAQAAAAGLQVSDLQFTAEPRPRVAL